MSVLSLNSAMITAAFRENNGQIFGQRTNKPAFEAPKESKRSALSTITNAQRRNPDRACKGKGNFNVQISQPNRRGGQKKTAPQSFHVYVDPPKANPSEVELHDHVLSLHASTYNGNLKSDDSPMIVSPFECKEENNTVCSRTERSACLGDSDTEYEEDILKYLKKVSMERRPRVGYMNKQPDINYNMRSILVDWLIEVSEEFSLDNRTLYLAVTYVDRFLSIMSVQRSKLQLVGTASLFIAAKFEEIYPPDASDFVYVTDDTYTQEQLLRMEQLILKTLEYNVSNPTVVDFLEIFLNAAGCQPKEQSKLRYLAHYLCELTLLDSRTFLKHLPANIAASAILLASHTLRIPILTGSLVVKSGAEVATLMACMDDLQDAFKEAPSLKYKVVIQKYSEKRMNVAKLAPVLQTFDYLF